MHFVKSTGWSEGVLALSKRLQDELKAGKRVLWLVCGGSNIPAVVKIMASLPEVDTRNLAIMLTDERYGEVGHVDSNTKQLYDAGFDPKQAAYVPALSGLSLEETLTRYSQAVHQAFEHAEVIIGQFGMGADGHIAGILPNSPAAESEALVLGYEAPNFTRMTLTFPALRKLTAAYVLVFGAEKAPALTQLRDEERPLDEQPAQIIKELLEAYVFNDQIGDRA